MPFHHPIYACFPGVVNVGKETRVAIVPEGSSRFFREEDEYEIWVGGMWDDLVDYHDTLIPNAPCEVKDGYLWFTFTFKEEMEYSVRFRKKDSAYTKLSVYAVEDDLFTRRPLKGDLHVHSYYSDGKDDVLMTAAAYREMGFDFYTLTDHNRYFTSEMVQEGYKDVRLGMTLLRGEEIHTPGSAVHIVHIGGRKSVADRYINDRENYEREVAEVEAGVTGVSEQYKHRYAMAKWACREAHKEEDSIVIFPHPFWRANIYNVSRELCDLLFDTKMFDAYEIMGGGPDDVNNLQVSLWQEQCIKGNIIPVVGSSDSHIHAFMQGQFARTFTILFAKSNSEKDIIDAVKNGWSVAAEISAAGSENIRFYGRHRFVMFAQFLFGNYFEVMRHMVEGEGELMRAYIREEIDGETLSRLADVSLNFYKRFYGLAPVVIPSKARRDFYEKWRTYQITKGPKTNGTSLEFYTNGKNKANR